jgi:hypothetical protein
MDVQNVSLRCACETALIERGTWFLKPAQLMRQQTVGKHKHTDKHRR